ncbi:unnamed protein product [Kuraishia capsulata CBS 1993]|uniref:GRAM domain-containing protein n=1 Tax=Kuraishia capsulata CBS 1993 TaxID=1382522 RepID=W6MXY8_9ASCO|nr:uncharacterized protein KUCA_T00005703001 [Kuraishia capsulata CBS 1993]CDK29710.1 unnamed protein product [Kuraishia capsulata CBS 1993]
MSLNWVMLKEGNPPFVLLPEETLKFQSPERNGIELKAKYEKGAANITATGRIFLTTKRIVFVSSHGDFNSFTILFPQIKAHTLEQPWFGPNRWRGSFVNESLENGLRQEVYDFTLVFNEGGAFEFVKMFDKVFTDVGEQLPAYSER